MRRTIWFSLFCLIGIAVLASVRALSPFGSKDVPKIPDWFEDEGIATLAKADKLVDNEDELRPDKVTVKTVKIFVQPPTPEETDPGVSKKHWRPAYARMRDRTHHATRRHHRIRVRSRR
jgi:hypothetical protein